MRQFAFIGCMGRSGSTLLRTMLDCHSQILSGPEFNHLTEIFGLFNCINRSIERERISEILDTEHLRDAFRVFIKTLFEQYIYTHNKPIFIEKSPSNIWVFNFLAEIFPDAKFIQMIRDPRDVVCSHLEVGKRFLKENKKPYSPALESAKVCARDWTKTVMFGESVCGKDSQLYLQNRVVTIKYEDLVMQPEIELKKVCKLLEVDFEPAMLEPHKTQHDVVIDNLWFTPEQYSAPVYDSKIGRWKLDLSLKDRLYISGYCQRYIELFQYDKGSNWIISGLNVSEPEFRQLAGDVHREIENDENIAKNSRGT